MFYLGSATLRSCEIKMKKNSIEYEVIMEATTIALVKKRLSGNGKEEIGMNLALERKNIIL